jgi:uncharacterized damage-inducible protein DinB
MTTPRNARMLTRYNAWADDLIHSAVAALPEGEALKPRKSVFKNIVHTLNHNYVIDQIFRAHLEGRDHGYSARNTPEAPPLEELSRAQRSLNDWYIAWSDGISEKALNESVKFTFVGGGNGEMTRGEILQHLVTHTSYHRGFVAQMFWEVPTTPPTRVPTTDLTVFLRDVPLDLD